MALECVCFPVNDPRTVAISVKALSAKQRTDRYCEDLHKPKPEVDLCKILERTRDNEQHRHNDYDCHLQGEGRQNLINKLKMYLDDYDDRPVMKRKSKGGEGEGKALGQTGFGPMIKYPGYVDYNHPYFSDTYNKMPTLATTVNQRGVNPCPPLSVRNWDATRGQGGLTEGGHAGKPEAHAKGGSGRKGDCDCRCAKRKGETAKCPAASAKGRSGNDSKQWARGMMAPSSSPALVCECSPSDPRMMAASPSGQMKYFCYPLPDN